VTPIYLDIETAPATDNEWSAHLALRGLRDGEDSEALRAESSLTGLARLLTVGVAVADGPIEVLGDATTSTPDVLAALVKYLRPRWSGSARIVGWNVSGFDVPMLAQLALRHGHPRFARSITGGLCAKPWELPVVDLMRLWPSPSGEYRKRGHTTQQEVCRRLGIPVQPGALGEDMAARLAAGDWDSIREHQRQDVEQVREIHRAMKEAM